MHAKSIGGGVCPKQVKDNIGIITFPKPLNVFLLPQHCKQYLHMTPAGPLCYPLPLMCVVDCLDCAHI